MKKKILHLLVSNTYNGAENVVCQIADLFKTDKEFEIIYCSPDGPIRNALKEHGVKFAPLRELSTREIKRVINEIKPSIVHAHDMRANFYALLSCRGIPLVSHIHNNNYDSRGLSLKSLFFYFAARNAKHIFWVSKTSYDGYYFKKLLNKKSEILYNVINTDLLKQKAGQDPQTYNFDFVYLGRLTFQKNPQRLIRVMEQSIEKASQIKFAILGEGELEEEIKDYIEQHKLSSNIFLLGYRSNPYKILQCSKAMIMTSRWEGLPMCALEAFALGVPVISTPADGLKELITNDIDGYLSDEDEELVREIIKIYHNPAYRERLSSGAIAKTQEIMNLSKYKESIRKIYSEIPKED